MKTDARTLWFHIDGILCYACVGIIEEAALSLPGVASAEVSYVQEALRLSVSGDFDPAALISLLEKRGYQARPVAEKEAVSAGDDLHRSRVRIVLSFLLSLTLVPWPFFTLPPWVRLLTATVIQFLAGTPFYRDAVYAAAGKQINMSVLVSLGTLTAYLYSAVSVLRGTGPVFFESGGNVLVLVMLGKYLERSARVSSAEAVRRLLETGPKEATLLADGAERVVPVDAIRTGDRFFVPRGGLSPADGTVLEGKSRMDEAGLTGESRPAEKQPGSRIYASAINLDGRLLAEAACDYGDSVYARMCRALLNGVSGEKARIQKLADRVCARFVPAVLLLAVFTLFLWYGFLRPGDLEQAFRCAIAVLIVACPCAMGIATPLAVTAAAGAMGQTGIFVKSPSALEALAGVKTVVFDKTGTLTLPDGNGGERLRAGAAKTCETLVEMGLEVWMLSGDTAEQAEKIAAQAGISPARTRAGLLPEEKAALLRELRQRGPVCMVGDGLNDALSLSAADVGIAIGRAASVSLECADVVITRNRITHVLKALYFGRVTLRNVRRSLFWSLCYNAVGLLLCVCGVVSPVVAGAAMSLSSLSVVLNARSLDGKLKKLSFEKILRLWQPRSGAERRNAG